MAHPLESSYNWRTPVLFASVGAVICIGVLARGGVAGWQPAIVLVLVLWAVLIGVVWLRTRAYLMVDGRRATVRRFRAFHTVEADDLVAVREHPSAQGPSYKLQVRDPAGGMRWVVAPVGLLRDGHPTLLRWILAQAPHATLDAGTQKTVDRLRIRGQIP